MPLPFNNPSELGVEGRRALDALQRSVSRNALLVANNLSDLDDAATARTNLGLGTAATTAATAYATAAQGATADAALAKASNLSDLTNVVTARTNLGLGTAATTAATAYATAAQGTKADNAAAQASNLSDLASAATARTNLGLGAVALLASVSKADLSSAAGELGAAWTTYTPTDTGVTVGNGTRSAAYLQVGKTVFFRWSLVGGTTSTLNATTNSIGLPVASKASLKQIVTAYYFDSGVRHWVGVAVINDTSTTKALLVHTESGATGVATSGAPSAAWFGSGDAIVVSGVYEAA